MSRYGGQPVDEGGNLSTPRPGSYGAFLREERKRADLTQEELAEKLSERLGRSIHQKQVSRWESEPSIPRSFATHQAIAEVLGTSVGEFFLRGFFPMPPTLGARLTMLSAPQRQAIQELLAASPTPEQLRECVRVLGLDAIPDAADMGGNEVDAEADLATR